MNLRIPELSLVVLIGVTGSGKSTFAREHFLPTEIVSSDACRALVSDDENSQAATKDAFELLHFIAAKRLARGRLTVIDATNVQPESRKSLVELARSFHCLPVAVVLDVPEKLCWERTQARSDREISRRVVKSQAQQLQRGIKRLKKEGFRHIYRLTSEEEIADASFVREPLWNNRKELHGPFDIIGDVHGCADELEELLAELGYRRAEPEAAYAHPEGRMALFLGDLVDRGPRILDTYRLVREMVNAGSGLCVPGNHDIKLMRKLNGRSVTISHGLEESLAELAALPEEVERPFKKEMAAFFRSLVSHYVLDGGRLVVAHAGMQENMQGRGSAKVRDFALYGETTGETDEFGLPIRYNWAAEYRGEAIVVYGHTPVPEPEWVNRTINIDTGCVFGGRLTALRYPEKTLVSVPARRVYAEPIRPLQPPVEPESSATPSERAPDQLRLSDVSGKRVIDTRLRGRVTIREENSIAALEVMSRYAVDPRWLIYLPPTMSPSETSRTAELLEHPNEAFETYRRQGIEQVVCEQKHMGSRVIVIVCRSAAVAHSRFGGDGEEVGIAYTRTGRRFFEDRPLEHAFLARLQAALTTAGWWEKFDTDWVALDCELMPWSAKAQALLREQYAAVGAAGRSSLSAAVEVLQGTTGRLPEAQALLEQLTGRLTRLEQYIAAYRHYCWPVDGLADLKLAPFHLLATAGKVHADQTHRWHMETLAELCQVDESLLLATPFRVVELADEQSCAEGVGWWEGLTAAGGEGMVVKPLDFIPLSRGRLIQPAIKSRGREYLRIIYGPEYTAPAHLPRLRQRSLKAKRSLALREFALGLEALERFVQGEPLYRVHECVFGVLALESEPVDPRL